MTKRLPVMVLVVVAAWGVTMAGDRFGVGIKAGTYGIAVDITGRINDYLAIRGSYAQFDHSDSIELDDIDYDGDLEVGGAGLMLDIHPFKNGFRLTAGYFSNRNDLVIEAVPTEDIEIGDSTYTPAEVGTLDGGADFEDTAPYFGIGYGNAARGPGRVRLILDAGVLMQGSAEISLSSSSGLISQDDIDQEIENLEEDAEEYDFWPVVAIGISFRI